jgi:hypothetical protein
VNRHDPYSLDARDRLLLCRSRVMRVASEARVGQREARTDDAREVWAALEQLAASIETLTSIELRRER